eukprot:CAMPEP_0204352512 /NCGR_PEP_ID=MMETSP0469-20131031/31946_1 /ASSEMBLY_ACC=CAM_ASM_000384 /TAXON_ID=2969 /ORGANISM="Oxyrrhis marina" /LENGTH=134 /DNA_ID=CAMNT_0051339257 /DNA_START=347 /DNA_END=747 /DNA_ORIENTATION=-
MKNPEGGLMSPLWRPGDAGHKIGSSRGAAATPHGRGGTRAGQGRLAAVSHHQGPSESSGVKLDRQRTVGLPAKTRLLQFVLQSDREAGHLHGVMGGRQTVPPSDGQPALRPRELRPWPSASSCDPRSTSAVQQV